MARNSKKKYQREITPDKVYHSKLIAKLINYVMLDGKKALARKIVYGALEQIERETKSKPLDVFEKALSNVMPELELKSRRIGGSNYQVPYEVSMKKKLIYSLS